MEVLVVVVIIAVLAMMVSPTFIGQIGKAKHTVAKQKITAIETAITTFLIDYDRWPVSLDELVSRPADIPEAKWEHPPIKAKDLLDPWGRKFIYKQPGDHGLFDLYSLGKDGQAGGEKEDADVVNWE